MEYAEHARAAVHPSAVSPVQRLHVWSRASTLARALSLLLILVAALTLRLRDLPASHGRLDIDEARLTLVAQGIAEHGWPVLPSGKVYTRGLIQSFSMAPSLMLLGPSDFAARLPSVVAGVLLIILMYMYGRSLAGPWAGLLASALTTAYGPLVAASREAWLYSIFVLLWVLTLYLFDRAITRSSQRALLFGAGAVALGFFAHELTLLLLPAVALSFLFWLRGAGEPRIRPALVALALIGVGLCVLAALTLALRSDTLAGSLGEVDDFLAFRNDLSGLRFYFTRLLPSNLVWLLCVMALASLVLARRGEHRRLLGPLLAIIPLLLVDAFVIPDLRLRYGLALVPPIFLLASVGVVKLADRLRFFIAKPAALAAGASLGVLMLALLFRSTDAVRNTTPERLEGARSAGTWMADLHQLGYKPTDLVVTDIPTIVYRYLGRTDGWLRSQYYEKYTYQSAELPRDIHTGGLLIRSPKDFNRLVSTRRSGEVVWVIGSDFIYQWHTWLDRSLREHLESRATLRMRSSDRTHVYKLEF